MIAQITRAVLFAIATVATLSGFRASRLAKRGSILPGLYFDWRTSDVRYAAERRLRQRFLQFALSGFFAGIGSGLYAITYEIPLPRGRQFTVPLVSSE